MRHIILGSASPRRRELLGQAGIPFEVIVSDEEEVMEKAEPQQVVQGLAAAKAKAVAGRVEGDALVIGADTVVALDGEILGKPGDEQDAVSMLEALQGRTHQVYTGVALVKKEGDEQRLHVFYERTEVTMYPMSRQEILDYVATGEPMDKAGAYGIQGRAGIFIKGICGDYNNVVGLPIGRLYRELRDWAGWEPAS